MRTGLVATNLFTNPNCETANGNGAVRTNLHTDPRMIVAAGQYAFTGTITPVTGITNHPLGITTANRVSYNSGDANPGLSLFIPAASTQYTISAWIYHEAITDVSAFAFAQNGVGSAPTIVGMQTGVWTRQSWTYTTGAGTNLIGFRLGGPATGNGSFLITGILIETHPALLDWFDGNTPPVGDFTYIWSGTPNASTSIQRAPGVASITLGNSAGVQSSEWYQSGSKSLRIVPNTGFNTSSALLGITLTAGKTYTCIATRRLPAPLTGVLSSYAGTIISVQVGVGTFLSPALPNVAGIAEARLTFYLDPANTANTLRLGHGGSAGSGDVWWDNILIVEGTYTGPYFSGDTPEGVTVIHRWTGTKNASTSEQYSLANAEGYNPSKALADARYSTMIQVLGSNPSRTLNGSFADAKKAAMEKVLTDNGLI